MDINYELYKMFYKVAKAGSFTRVAEESFISQSAVTQAMKKLENQLGGTLFIRAKTGVTLTPEGQTLYEYINNSLETLNSAENLFSKYKNLEQGEIRINCGQELAHLILLKPLLKFSNDYPNVKISITNDKAFDSLTKIANGTLDLAIFTLPIKNEYDNITIEEIADSDMCFFTNKKYNKELEKTGFNVKNINKYCLAFPTKGTNTRKWLDANFAKIGIEADTQYEFTTGTVLIEFVRKSKAIGYANKRIVLDQMGDDAVILADDFNYERREVGVAYLNKKIASSAVVKFVEYLNEYSG